MAESNLILHRGAIAVTPEQLKEYRTPAPVGRWFPIAHTQVREAVIETLTRAGYSIRAERLGVTPDGSRYFGTLDLGTGIQDGVALAVGIRNSVDKTLPLGFAAGSRVFCCDNLAFHSELLVSRKHTRFGETRFMEAIVGAVGTLSSFREIEGNRIGRFQKTEISDERADSLILRSFETEIIGHRDLPKVVKEWRTPSYPSFEARTLWSLFNAYTTVLRSRAEKHPASFANQTIKLNALLDQASKVSPQLQLAV